MDSQRYYKNGRQTRTQLDSAYQNHPTSQQFPANYWSNKDDACRASYFSPSPVRTGYANHLIIDDDYTNTTSATPLYQQHANPYSSSAYSQQLTRQNQYADHQRNHNDRTYPPTMQLWSREPSTEERMRLGLPRYESVEQERRAFENATRSYRQYEDRTR